MESNLTTIDNLKLLLSYNIHSLIKAEIALQHTLNEWTAKAISPKLKTILLKYADYVVVHEEKLVSFIAEEEHTFHGTVNKLIDAFISDINNRLKMCTTPELSDAALLAGIQQINHYKICAYGTAAAYANLLNQENYAAVFHEAEVNEKHIDDRLTQLAEHEVNIANKVPATIPKVME